MPNASEGKTAKHILIHGSVKRLGNAINGLVLFVQELESGHGPDKATLEVDKPAASPSLVSVMDETPEEVNLMTDTVNSELAKLRELLY